MSQVSTRPVTLNAIMRSAAFKAGYADALAGRFNPDTFGDIQGQWRYERGWAYRRFLERHRIFGQSAPRKIAMANRARVSSYETSAYNEARKQKEVI